MSHADLLPFFKATTVDPLALLLQSVPPEMLAEALPLAIARLKLTPLKLALLLVRLMNPNELIKQGEEAALRGVNHETLVGYKCEKSLPRLLGA